MPLVSEIMTASVQVVGPQEQDAEDLLREVAVTLDVRERPAGGLEVGQDVQAPLLLLDLIGQATLIPLAHRDIFVKANGLRHHLIARGKPGAPVVMMVHGLAGQ